VESDTNEEEEKTGLGLTVNSSEYSGFARVNGTECCTILAITCARLDI